jgi:hypothetical protein
MDKPVTAQEAVEAYNVLRIYCGDHKCYDCVFGEQVNKIYSHCKIINSRVQQPDHWPDIKEAPHA